MRFYASGVPDTGVYYSQQDGGERERGIISAPIHKSAGSLAPSTRITTTHDRHRINVPSAQSNGVFARQFSWGGYAKLTTVKRVTRAASLKGLPDACTVIDCIDKTTSLHPERSIQSARDCFPAKSISRAIPNNLAKCNFSLLAR